MTIDRKLFLVQLASGALALKLAGCGGGGDSAAAPSPAPAPPPPVSCGNFSFSANHGHQLVIPGADLNSTVDKTYSVQGSAGHDHQVTLSSAQLAQLKAGGTVSVSSTADAGHSHGMSGGCT